MNIYKITTEDDCEGRTTRDLGIYKGTLEQIITYMTLNNIKPYYGYKAVKVEIVDCSQVKPEVNVTEGKWGNLNVVTSKELAQQAAKQAALAKLTKEEREALGL